MTDAPEEPESPERVVGDQMMVVIGEPDAGDILADLVDAGLAAADVLEDLPAVGVLIKIFRAVPSIRDKLLMKKVISFLRAATRAPAEARQAFMKTLNERETQELGEALVLALDRLDSMKKPAMLGRVLRALAEGRIDRRRFDSMVAALDRLTVRQLEEMRVFYSGERECDRDALPALAFVGVVHMRAKGNGGGAFGAEFAGAVLRYEKNDLGRDLVDILATRDRDD